MAGGRFGRALKSMAAGDGGITIAQSVYDALPAAFTSWYRGAFTGTRMLYGHWSQGPYSRAIGNYHRQIAVLKPLDLDELIDRFLDVRQRRIGGAISSAWHQIEEMKKHVELQVFETAPYDADLDNHTRGRNEGSIAIALMGARGVRPNDLGTSAPLPEQLREMARLVAEACAAVRSPVERFMTHSEAADNLDFPRMDDPSAPTPPYGWRTTRETWDLEAWIDVETLELSAPLQSARPGWVRLGDWLREASLRRLADATRSEWQ